MQTITQIPTKTYLLLFGPFTMFLEICMQIHSVVIALNRQINNQQNAKKMHWYVSHLIYLSLTKPTMQQRFHPSVKHLLCRYITPT